MLRRRGAVRARASSRGNYADVLPELRGGGPAGGPPLHGPRHLLDAGGRARARLLLLLRRAARHAHGPDAAARRAHDRERVAGARGSPRSIREYGEDRYARRIAREIVRTPRARPDRHDHRAGGRDQARDPDAGAVRRRAPGRRTFQAIRIAVNDELGSLERALPAAWELLRPGGRMAVISFHSLEDRRVKRFFADLRAWLRVPAGASRLRLRARARGRAGLRAAPCGPSAGEVADNPRAQLGHGCVPRSKLRDGRDSGLDRPPSRPQPRPGAVHPGPPPGAGAEALSLGSRAAPAQAARAAPAARPVRHHRRVSGPARPATARAVAAPRCRCLPRLSFGLFTDSCGTRRVQVARLAGASTAWCAARAGSALLGVLLIGLVGAERLPAEAERAQRPRRRDRARPAHPERRSCSARSHACGSSERIQQEARRHGPRDAAAAEVHYLTAHPRSDGRRAARNVRLAAGRAHRGPARERLPEARRVSCTRPTPSQPSWPDGARAGRDGPVGATGTTGATAPAGVTAPTGATAPAGPPARRGRPTPGG